MNKRFLFVFAALLAITQRAWAQTEWDQVYLLTQTTSANWTPINAGSTDGYVLGTSGTTTYYYTNSNFSFTNSNAGGSGLTIRGTVYLYIPYGTTLTCTGANASGTTGGGAGIELTEGNTLCLIGSGTVNATGGNAANGGNGANGGDAECTYDVSILGGSGGNGDNGGGGAGAGIGTRGANGGANGGNGGAGGQRNGSYGQETTQYGVDGNAGSAGSTAGAMGNLYVVTSSVNLSATGGSAGSSGTGGNRGLTASQHPGSNLYMASGGGGGGAGGFGGGASNIGTGGPGGGGGGGGAAGNVAWVVYSGTANGYYHAGAKGGKGGTNSNSTPAPDGASIELTNPKYADIQAGGLRPNASDYDDDDGWENGNAWHDGGAGGGCGNASSNGSAVSLALWPTSGAGTAESPYLLNNAAEWNTFATNVNNGISFNGKYIQLNNSISVSTMVGLCEESPYAPRPFSGTFLGNGKTLTVSISSSATGTGTNEQGVAPFHYIKGATIKDLTVAGTIASASYYTAGIVGFAHGSNLIEGCTVTATLNISNNYAGGIIGHAMNSITTVKDCFFNGTFNGVSGSRINIGAIWGWCNSAIGVLQNCWEKGTYNNITSMHPMGLMAVAATGTVTTTSCLYVNQQIGTPTNANTIVGASQVSTSAPGSGIYGQVMTPDNSVYYLPCVVSGIKDKYVRTGSAIVPDIVVTCNEIALENGTDYEVTIANNVNLGTAQVTVTGKGSYSGTESFTFSIVDYEIVNSAITRLQNKAYKVIKDTRIDWDRVVVEGDVILILGEGTTLEVPFGIEVSAGNSLTIEGPGTLRITGWLSPCAGIGADNPGTIIINGGTINVHGGMNSAGLGGSQSSTGAGRVIINGGVVNATGDGYAPGIGAGGYGRCCEIVINGGRVTANHGAHGDRGIGVDNNNDLSGTLTISWTHPDDFIRSIGGNRLANVTFVNGKQFVYEGTQNIATGADFNTGGEKKIVPFIATGTLPGAGTEENPYSINSTADWNAFVANVITGNSYSGQYVKLTNNISVTQKCGYVIQTTPSRAFSGTFLGNNKIITATINDMSTDYGTALFSYINGATIKNLTVAGTITSANKHAAGLVSYAEGTNLIEACYVTATLNIKSNYAGGIIGHGMTSATTIEESIFAGTFNGIGGNRANVGGIWGWSTDGTPTLQSCLEAGSYNNISSMHPIGLQGNSGSIGNSYYVHTQIGSPANACIVSGALQAYTSAPDNEIYWQFTAADGHNYYLTCTVNDVLSSYEWQTGSPDISFTPVVKGVTGATLSLGTDYTAKLDNNNVASFPITINSAGTHTLILTGKGDYYTGSKTFSIVLHGPFAGTGTSEDAPYLINNATDWAYLADNVAYGKDYSGKYFKLTANIDVTEMVGTIAHDFKGTFDGGGNTLTFTKGTSERPFAEDHCAPFRSVSNATIKNLKVTGNIYSFKKYAAGLVARSNGTTYINSCVVGTVIHSGITGDGTHGGIVGHPYGPLTISNSVYNGRLLTNNGTTKCGGFVGWYNDNTVNVNNSLYAPNTSITPTAGETDITDGATFVRGGNINEYCYYTEALGDANAQGIQVFATLPGNEVCIQAQALDGNMYYHPCTVSGVEATYKLEDHPAIPLAVTGLNGALELNQDYTATLNGAAVEQNTISITAGGYYTLILTGISNDYTGSKQITFVVTHDLPGTGTVDEPYLIENEANWNQFAVNVASGMDYSGKYVKLNANINVTSMVGTSEHPFKGIFLGDDNYTLTFTAGSASGPFNEGYCAPFRYVENATIENLKVAGNIYMSKKFAAGLVSRTLGTTNITNCIVSTVIHSSIAGDGTHGGIVSMPSGTLNMTGCVYDGRLFTTNGTNCCAGLIGWHNGCVINFSNSFYIPNIGITPAAGETAITNGATIVRGRNATQTCYYAETLGEAQGTRIYVSYGNDFYKKITANSHTYYQLCTIINVTDAYQYTGENITIVPTVTAADGTVLTNDTDYTYVFNPSPVNGKGDYTLTITAKGSDCVGSKSISFAVTDINPMTAESTELTTGEYKVYGNITVNQRITISGDVVLNLGAGNTLTAKKGIELSEGNKLTINGPGSLIIDDCNDNKSGIGAVRVGTLVINGGYLNVKGHATAAGLGGDHNNTSGGSITINGGVVIAEGGVFSAGIGGGVSDSDQSGVCGDIVINGGQVTAGSSIGFFGIGIGPGYRILGGLAKSGTLTIGWTNPDDFVKSIGHIYKGETVLNSVTFVEGKRFFIDGTQTIATAADIEGNKIVPAMTILIDGYGEGNDGWAFIASPVSGSIAPTAVGSLVGSQISTNPVLYDYDLYRFNQSAADEWENYHQHNTTESPFLLENGQGYLYATKETKTLVFSGTFNTDNTKTVYLVYDAGKTWAGWNLVGNPFTVATYVNKPFYKMNEDGTGIEAVENANYTETIAACHGIIVQATDTDQSVTFTKTTSRGTQEVQMDMGRLQIALSQDGPSTSSATLLDNAIVSFNEGSELGKFYFGTQNANIYLPQNGKDYAIAFSDKQGEVPVNFKANKNGTYTLSFSGNVISSAAKKSIFTYLHLIDNLTGADIDLLAGDCGSESAMTIPGYTFTAKTTDYESRFRLVFSATEGDGASTGSATFAFMDAGGNWIISNDGRAILQVVDAMGRILSNETINGSVSKNINGTPGVYVIRLINGDSIRTQKIVVK